MRRYPYSVLVNIGLAQIEQQKTKTPSGIRLPNTERLPLRQVTRGLWIVDNAYDTDTDYFEHPSTH